MEQALSPLKARDPSPGPPGSMGCRLRPLAAWAAGYGREIRSPLEQGSPGRGGVPSRLMSPGTQVQGRLAAWAAGRNGREFRSPLEQGSPGRGGVPSRLMSPGTQVQGRLAAWAAGGNGREFRSPLEQVSQGEEGTHRGLCLQGPRSMAKRQLQLLENRQLRLSASKARSSGSSASRQLWKLTARTATGKSQSP
jgi:hypothetical protein